MNAQHHWTCNFIKQLCKFLPTIYVRPHNSTYQTLQFSCWKALSNCVKLSVLVHLLVTRCSYTALIRCLDVIIILYYSEVFKPVFFQVRREHLWPKVGFYKVCSCSDLLDVSEMQKYIYKFFINFKQELIDTKFFSLNK